ncbi:MAG: MFS transporter, partial [Anaerolineales bacterium]|nr:MFS transporter [Anaerolineales bacterium]
LAATLTHFTVDVLNSSRTLVVALLAISLGLTNQQVGIALIVYNLGAALTQPLFGLLADRYGPRWIIIGGMGWMIFFYTLAATAGDWLALIAVTMAGLGSGAFHPAGTKVASQTPGTHRNQATALFFTIGQFGLFAGPVIAGILLDRFDRSGYIALPIMAILALLLDWSASFDKPEREPVKSVAEKKVAAAAARAARPVSPWAALPVAIIVLCTNSFAISVSTYTPILFAEQGYGQTYIGWAAGLVMLGSAIGVLVGGILADRWSAKWTVVVGVMLAFIPGYFYLPAGDPLRLPLLALAGFLGGMPHSILVILMQSILPKREGMATGLTLGFMFFAGSVGSLVVGRSGDGGGGGTTLRSVPFILLAGALAATFLPRFKHQR